VKYKTGCVLHVHWYAGRRGEGAASNTTRHPPHTLTHSTGCGLLGVGKKYEKSMHTGAAPHPRAQTPSFYVATDLKELL